MAIAPAVAFLIGHFTGYGETDDLDMDQLTTIASGSFGVAALAIAALSVVVPSVSMLLGPVTGVSTTYVTGILGQLTSAMDIFLEAGLAGLFAFIGTYVGYGLRVVREKYLSFL